MRFLPIFIALVALAGCQKQAEAPANQAAPAAAEAGPQKGIDRSHKGQPAPAVAFTWDEDEIKLSDDRGVPTLVNLWATWCAPCVKELPTLDRLVSLKGPALNVVAVSQDSGPHASVVAFLHKLKLTNLETIGAFQDPKMNLSGALGPDTVLPTTILYDAEGKEVWRYVGDLDWTSPEAAKLLSEASAPAKG